MFLFRLFPNNFDDLLAGLELVHPLPPHPLDLSAEAVLLKPHNQLSQCLRVDLLHHLRKHHFDYLTLRLYRFEDSVQLLREVFVDGGLFDEALLEFGQHRAQFGRI
jgi:hypothetical protein